MKIQASLRAVALGAIAVCSMAAQAADWSDTSIGYRYGTKFAEPFNGKDIAKSILDFNHVSGYKYGTNFFNIDLLLSDKNDPSGVGAGTGAQEAYVVYRNFLDIGKVSGTDYKMGAMRGWGITSGFDWNAKTDAGYNSKKRMLVLGPTVELDVPGFLNVGVQELWESNAPCNNFNAGTAYAVCVSRYSYKPHASLNAVWGIPVGSSLSFEGYASWIASKGNNEYGGKTAAESHIDASLMLDAGPQLGFKPKSLRIGLEYEWWKNKFGNDSGGPAGKGAFAKTPMIRVEYHF